MHRVGGTTSEKRAFSQPKPIPLQKQKGSHQKPGRCQSRFLPESRQIVFLDQSFKSVDFWFALPCQGKKP